MATPANDCQEGTRISCSDVAKPFLVTELLGDGLAMVDTGAGLEEISVALVTAEIGDVVLVHAKEAIAVVSADALTGAPVGSGSLPVPVPDRHRTDARRER